MAITITLAILLIKSGNQKPNYPNKSVVLRWNRTGITVAGITSNCGNASNQLCSPWGVYMDWSNTLYIADLKNNRVQKYLQNASFGETVAGHASGANESGSDALYNPFHVHVDLDGNVYVADSYNHRVQLWTRGSSNGTTIAGITGQAGYMSNQLYYPMGIFRDPIKNGLYIVDYANQRVMYYPTGIRNGTLVAGGVYYDVVSGSFIIANRNSNNTVRWILGATKWTLIAGYMNGTSGSTASTFLTPTDVTLDPMGNVYVADYDNSRVQFFSVGETNGITIAGNTSLFGSSQFLFQHASSVTLDSQLNLYVSDHVNHRIQKFMRY